MDKAALLALADRVEALTGADREVDLAISVAIDYRNAFEGRTDWEWTAGGDEIGLPRVNPLHRSKYLAYLDPAQFVPRWTTSLDAAITLVPKGVGGEKRFLQLTIAPLGCDIIDHRCEIIDTIGGQKSCSKTLTGAASALTAAALRAMAGGEDA